MEKQQIKTNLVEAFKKDFALDCLTLTGNDNVRSFDYSVNFEYLEKGEEKTACLQIIGECYFETESGTTHNPIGDGRAGEAQCGDDTLVDHAFLEILVFIDDEDVSGLIKLEDLE